MGIATTVVILAAAYILVVQRVFFNPVTNPENQGLPDATPRELAVLVPLIVRSWSWMGVIRADLHAADRAVGRSAR